MQQPETPNGPDMNVGDKFTLNRWGMSDGPRVLIGEVVTAKPWSGTTEYGYKLVEVIAGPDFLVGGGVGSIFYFSPLSRPSYTWEILHDDAPISTEIKNALGELAELANVTLGAFTYEHLTNIILDRLRGQATTEGKTWTERGAVEKDVTITVTLPRSNMSLIKSAARGLEDSKDCFTPGERAALSHLISEATTNGADKALVELVEA